MEKSARRNVTLSWFKRLQIFTDFALIREIKYPRELFENVIRETKKNTREMFILDFFSNRSSFVKKI